jgi:hypothetical protein
LAICCPQADSRGAAGFLSDYYFYLAPGICNRFAGGAGLLPAAKREICFRMCIIIGM